MLTKDIVEGEDSRRRDRKRSCLVLRAAVMLCGDLSIQGVHDEVIGIIGANMNVIGPDCKRRHVEVAVVANGEVLATPIEPGTIEPRDLVPAIAVTGKGFHRFKRAVRNWVS